MKISQSFLAQPKFVPCPLHRLKPSVCAVVDTLFAYYFYLELSSPIGILPLFRKAQTCIHPTIHLLSPSARLSVSDTSRIHHPPWSPSSSPLDVLSKPRRLDGDTGGSPCFCVKHPDLHGARLDKQDAYGLGSAHYLRDLGDCIKLVKALGSLPVGGSSTVGVGMARGGDANTVALVGGGLLCMEVAAAIVTHYP